MREIEVTDEFETWWDTLTIDQQEALNDRVVLLGDRARISGGRSSNVFTSLGTTT